VLSGPAQDHLTLDTCYNAMDWFQMPLSSNSIVPGRLDLQNPFYSIKCMEIGYSALPSIGAGYIYYIIYMYTVSFNCIFCTTERGLSCISKFASMFLFKAFLHCSPIQLAILRSCLEQWNCMEEN